MTCAEICPLMAARAARILPTFSKKASSRTPETDL